MYIFIFSFPIFINSKDHIVLFHGVSCIALTMNMKDFRLFLFYTIYLFYKYPYN